FGRIEELFAGGRLEARHGSMVLPPHPASAAGRDLRQLVLGSEGRFGILTETIVRVGPRPRVEAVPSWVLGEWPRAVDAARDIARARLPLSMVRLSTPIETATTLALAGEGRGVRALRAYLRFRRVGPEPCLLLVAASGDEKLVELAVREVGSIVRRHGGTGIGGSPGRQWLRSRFRVPDLRDALWELGYAIDTLETAVDWSRLPDLAADPGRTLRHGLDDVGERGRAAERPGPRLRSARHGRRARQDPDRPVRLAAAGLGRAGRGGLLAGDRRGVHAAVGRRRRAARRDRGRHPDDPAGDRRGDRRGRRAAPAGDRLARPAAGRRGARDRRPHRSRLPRRRCPPDRRRVPGRLR